MKKIALIMALVAIGSVASATTLSWGGNAATAQIYGLTSGTPMSVSGETASMTIYYFRYSDYDTIVGKGQVAASELSTFVVASAAGQTSPSTSAAGRAKGSTTTTDFTAAGATFFARAYATFSGTEYFIDLFGGAGTDGVWVNTLSGDAATKETLAWANGTYGGATSNTVGTKNAWVPAAAVPEPATGALALAGIALLFKRRKARA